MHFFQKVDYNASWYKKRAMGTLIKGENWDALLIRDPGWLFYED